MNNSEPKSKFLIDTENVDFIIANIKNKVNDKNYKKVMNKKKVTRTIYRMPYLEKDENRWLRILIGDVDCHENTGVTISYKLRNAKEGQEKKTPILRVEEYEPAKNFFEQLGFTRSSTQENFRTKIYVTFENIKYMVRFDVWPEIEDVTFVTVEEVTPTDPRSKEAFIKQLNLSKYDISKGTMVDIDNVYKDKLGFRASDIPELRFGFDLREQSFENRDENSDENKMNLLYLWLSDELEDVTRLYFAFKKSSKSIESVLKFLENND